ncbi:MAG: hypothetical protein ACRD0K_12245 [Egibacteraceae bacterium]
MTENANLRDLEQAAADLEARLATADLTPEIVREATSVFGELGRDEAIIELLARYLDRPLAAEEEAWARWEMVNQLTVLDRCDGAVEAQLALLRWARQGLPADRLLWVMADETQALCWVAVGRHEEWLRIFEELLARAAPAPPNRLDRLRLMRTAGVMLAQLQRQDAALDVARMMRGIADEDPDWAWAFWARAESRIVQLHAYQASGTREALRTAAVAVMKLLDHQHERLKRGEGAVADPVMLRTLYQSAAVPVYRAGEYALAVPLLERAIELGATAPDVFESLSRARARLESDRPRFEE